MCVGGIARGDTPRSELVMPFTQKGSENIQKLLQYTGCVLPVVGLGSLLLMVRTKRQFGQNRRKIKEIFAPE